MYLPSQSVPVKPGAQTHENLFIPSTHTACGTEHGLEAHSSTSMSQLAPANPGVQTQINSSTKSIHTVLLPVHTAPIQSSVSE